MERKSLAVLLKQLNKNKLAGPFLRGEITLLRWMAGPIQKFTNQIEPLVEKISKLCKRRNILVGGATFFEGLDQLLGFSTPNFFQFLPDSLWSGVDNFQLGWSKTVGLRLYYFTWWLLGTPGGMFDDVTLFNERTNPQKFDLSGDRTLNGLNVVGNSWTLSGGTLTFRPPAFNGYSVLRYSGTHLHL